MGSLIQKCQKHATFLSTQKVDFSIKTTWCCFATKHRKSPCDSFCETHGTAKRLTARATLQGPAVSKTLNLNGSSSFA